MPADCAKSPPWCQLGHHSKTPCQRLGPDTLQHEQKRAGFGAISRFVLIASTSTQHGIAVGSQVNRNESAFAAASGRSQDCMAEITSKK